MGLVFHKLLMFKYACFCYKKQQRKQKVINLQKNLKLFFRYCIIYLKNKESKNEKI